MKVQATIKKQETVKLDDSTLKEIVLKELNKIYNWNDNFYVEDGYVYEDVERTYTARSITSTKQIRKATELDIEAHLYISQIRHRYNNYEEDKRHQYNL